MSTPHYRKNALKCVTCAALERGTIGVRGNVEDPSCPACGAKWQIVAAPPTFSRMQVVIAALIVLTPFVTWALFRWCW